MRYKIEVQDETGIWSDVRGDDAVMFMIEVENGRGLWTDVRGEDGKKLVFESEDAARAALAERFPVLVQMEKYAGGKRTRVIRIIEDED